MKIAAIDQGTSSTRVAVVNSEGMPEICHSLSHRQFYPADDQAEHDPLELLRNVRACLEAAGDVDAFGLANQGESCLAWDSATLEPLSPVILWHDNRTRSAVEQMRREGLEQVTVRQAGLPLSPYFSASKFRWLIDSVPAVQDARRHGRLRLGTTDAFLLEHLTGEFATDPSTASRTSLLNLQTGDWDPVLCEIFGVPVESLPPIRATVGSFGSVGGVPVTTSITDQQAALYGHGCRLRGDAKITFGTGAFLLSVTGNEVPGGDTHGLLATVAWKRGTETTFALDGGVFHAGSVVAWLRRLGLAEGFDDLNAFTAEPAVSRGLIFVPALSGLACPHWDSSAAACWVGMTDNTTQRDLCQSALEGVALRTVEVISALERCLPLSSPLSIDGGLARSEYFSQFLADASGKDIAVHFDEELTALGCAQLAALGVGVTLPAAKSSLKRYSPRNFPRDQWIERFDRAIKGAKAWHLPEQQ